MDEKTVALGSELNDGLGVEAIGVKPDCMWPGYLRVSDFGVTFDGKTNDYENLLHAIETAKNAKLLLTLPNGQAVKLW